MRSMIVGSGIVGDCDITQELGYFVMSFFFFVSLVLTNGDSYVDDLNNRYDLSRRLHL
jgi:hypothetical protein